VLDAAEVAASPMMTLHRFHGTLMVPGVGRKIVGWLGWGLFLSCATGLWLWVPRLGSWLAGFRWSRGSSQLFNLHHAMGIWLCLPLAALALTGVYISFPQTAQKLTGQKLTAPGGPPPRPPRAAPLLAAPTLTPAEAVAAALESRPQAQIAQLDWPQAGKKAAWRVEFAGGAKPVEVGDATSAVRDARARPARAGLPALMRGLHDGSKGGAAWRWLITLTGLTPLILGVTGLIMWLRRPKRRRAAAAATAAA
jgi:uncharacterized iron-regulated membrane protein